ncbi:MAG: FGGY family carbohydrate kinase [Lentisphaeria bacterium]|jgi:sugar (pentulose or hexulose) kinase|nr:FGGY family carbohydrate kinase [Lentisphaeria bacterium]
MKRLVLAVDCGSTNLKAGLFDAGLERLAEISAPVVYTCQGPERYEFSPETFWHSACGAMLELGDLAGITDLALSSQAQTFLFTDPGGKPLTPLVSWLDRTAAAAAAEARKQLGADFHPHCSFPEPIPQLQLCKARQWRDRDPALANARLVTLPGWLALHLGAENGTDENLAAMGGLYSLSRRDWWAEALAFAGLRADQLPRLVRLGEAIPARPAIPGFPPDLRVTFAGNDQTAGAYGNGVGEGTVLATLGTALVAYRCVGNRPGACRPGVFRGPYPGNRHYELATRDEGCLALDRMRQERFSGLAVREFDQLALTYQPTLESVLFHPERQALPATDHQTELAYATLEGIGFALRELLEENLGLARGRETVKLAGGGGKSPVWRQLIASILACPTSRAEGDALLGAAALALGIEPSAGSGQGRCEPDPAQVELLERRYRRWRQHD